MIDLRETVLTNVDLVLDHDIVSGTIVFRGAEITDIDESRSHAQGAVDGDGDLLLPGLVEIHTDALEWHLRPRPQSLWPAAPAVAAHDAMLASCGVTTVLDSLCIGDLGGDGFRPRVLSDAIEAITRIQHSGGTRIDHKLHYRCEVADPRTPELLESLIENPLVALVSLMDHTPGGRQYRDLTDYRSSSVSNGSTATEVDERIERLQARQAEFSAPNWRAVAVIAHARGLPLASHDDATLDDIELAIETGVTISEFPTTEVAAAAARRAGMQTAAGAPNIVRGGSHSGNVAAADLAAQGLLDIITSDYVPYSQLLAPFVLAHMGIARLSDAIAMVSSRPAEALGMFDRGRLEIGRRADLVRVRLHHDVPSVRSVYSAGRRVG
jgi:alpha-D-ribose 1-methylphosphonate 5-triphosphate diphosphatase